MKMKNAGNSTRKSRAQISTIYRKEGVNMTGDERGYHGMYRISYI